MLVENQSLLLWLARAGTLITIIGCCGLVLGLANIFDMEVFAYGLSSGIRIIGSLAIAGCLISAIAYGVLEHREHHNQE
jgi:hypothetical protein